MKTNFHTRGWILPARLAIRELASHRMRTAVTASAVFFGVAALMVMGALSRGMEDSNRKMYLQMGGAQVLQATARTATSNADNARYSMSPGLRLSDVDALQRNLPGFDAWAPEVSVGRDEIQTETGPIRAMATASTWKRFEMLSQEFDTTDGLTERAWESGRPIAVVGPRVASQVVKTGSALGAEIIVSGVKVRIVGIFKTSGNFDRRSREVALPISWYRSTKANGDPALSSIRAQVAVFDSIPKAREALRRELIALHRGIEDVDLSTNDDLFADSRKTLLAMSLVTILISSVALLSGGVGILNIQLASLSARVNELGVCKALGATSGLIFRQMFLESLLVSGGGGILGCLAGLVPGLVMKGMLPWTPRLSVADFVMGVAISFGLGTFAGLLPAIRAARLDPVEAMRA
ncbi:MAG: ABC transporter permease [Fibrobacterota bacterium]|nr:ABC transporter permease [Fibrobacterota bacterium]QQS07255.1 MAG: ABC transporter permease [Fibrobacterota bacterium]